MCLVYCVKSSVFLLIFYLVVLFSVESGILLLELSISSFHFVGGFSSYILMVCHEIHKCLLYFLAVLNLLLNFSFVS